MIRTIIQIEEEKCNGCGLCVNACHEGAITLIDGKAKLIRDDYCDGLGNCLPVCPTGAISFEEREALDFDEEAVKKMMEEKKKKETATPIMTGCPGSRAALMNREPVGKDSASNITISSRLNQWPVQIKLVNPKAPYFTDCDLLIAADCSAFAYGNFHNEFMKDKITIIGCPKLDDVDYSDKLTEIIRMNSIKSVTVVRMEVPCCGGIEYAARTAVMNSGKDISYSVVTLSTEGELL